MKYDRPLIIGPTHHNTYSMMRCFGESGVTPDVILYGKTDSYILHSCHIATIHVTSNATDALRVLQENYTEAVVIACADEIASLMDRDFDGLCPHFWFFNCGNRGKLTYLMNKSVQTALATEVGFRVPSTMQGLPSEVVDGEPPYPCIIKPLESIHGGKNIQICYSKDELSTATKLFDPEGRVLVQEFIEKDEEIVVVGLSFGNNLVIPAYIHKCRETKGGTTFSSVKAIGELPQDVLATCKDIIKAMNYQGLFGIELIRKGNVYYFVEVNLRNDATTYAVCVAGCNLPLAYWKLCNGVRIESVPFNEVRQINAMVEYEDFNFVLKRKVSLIRWIKEYRSSECKYFYSNIDTEISKLKKKEYIKFLRKRIFKF